jgi:hypothetical protein
MSCSMFLGMRNVSGKGCRENQNMFYVQYLFPKFVLLLGNVEKCGTPGQATDDNIIRHMRFACWVNKAADTLSECVIIFRFEGNSGFANAPQYYAYMYIASLVCNQNELIC